MVGSFATLTVLMKNSLMENLSQDYVRTAFAKGLSEKRVIFYHAVRNSLIPKSKIVILATCPVISILNDIFSNTIKAKQDITIDNLKKLQEKTFSYKN